MDHASIEEFNALAPALIRPDAIERLGEIVATTELQGVYEEVFGPASFGASSMGPAARRSTTL